MPKILVVEDDVLQQKGLDMSLRRRLDNCEVVLSSGGEEAWARLEAGERFDAIISDTDMPGGSGLALLQRVRKRFGPLPFILLSGKLQDQRAAQAEVFSAPFIAKPYSFLKDLLPVLQELLSRKLN